MGWFTKKTKRWEIRKIAWSLVSVLLFFPFPIHIHPLVMIAQARRAKVRSWLFMGGLFLCVELGLLASFIVFFGSLSKMMLLTMGASVLSYILGNGFLLNQVRPYLQRLELAELRPLVWIAGPNSAERLIATEGNQPSAQLFVERLLHWRKEIDNDRIKQDIDQILKLFQLLEKKDQWEADKFLVRHETVIHVLMHYDELENAGLNNQVSDESKRKLQRVIRQATAAIENEVTNQFKTGLLDVSAETDVYLESLKSRNLLKE